MKSFKLTQAECSIVEKALRWFISDLQRDICRLEQEGHDTSLLNLEVEKLRRFKQRFV